MHATAGGKSGNGGKGGETKVELHHREKYTKYSPTVQFQLSVVGCFCCSLPFLGVVVRKEALAHNKGLKTSSLYTSQGMRDYFSKDDEPGQRGQDMSPSFLNSQGIKKQFLGKRTRCPGTHPACSSLSVLPHCVLIRSPKTKSLPHKTTDRLRSRDATAVTISGHH